MGSMRSRRRLSKFDIHIPDIFISALSRPGQTEEPAAGAGAGLVRKRSSEALFASQVLKLGSETMFASQALWPCSQTKRSSLVRKLNALAKRSGQAFWPSALGFRAETKEKAARNVRTACISAYRNAAWASRQFSAHNHSLPSSSRASWLAGRQLWHARRSMGRRSTCGRKRRISDLPGHQWAICTCCRAR